MKSEKGITLTSLIIYIVILLLLVSTLSIVSSHFYSNSSKLTETGKYTSEYNKFNMYFIEDIKNNNNVYTIAENKLVFNDGVTYFYSNGHIYRNKVKICNNIEQCIFNMREETDENDFTKKIISVNLKIKSTKIFETENEYVLKYW